MPGDKVYKEIYHCEKHKKSYCLLNTAFNLTENVNFHIFSKGKEMLWREERRI